MATLRGKHAQDRTGRELTYWCAYDVVGEGEDFYIAVINEGRALLGQHEADLRFEPHGIPTKAIVRMNLLKYLDRTSFGEGNLPDAKWIGWYGRSL